MSSPTSQPAELFPPVLEYKLAPTCSSIFYIDYDDFDFFQDLNPIRKRWTTVKCKTGAEQIFESGNFNNIFMDLNWLDWCSVICLQQFGDRCRSFMRVYQNPGEYKCRLFSCSPLDNNIEFPADLITKDSRFHRYAWIDPKKCDYTGPPTFPKPTNQPTNFPTFEPTPEPSPPTLFPTPNPTKFPTHSPSYNPTIEITPEPTFDPTFEPTLSPTMLVRGLSTNDILFIVLAVVLGVVFFTIMYLYCRRRNSDRSKQKKRSTRF